MSHYDLPSSFRAVTRLISNRRRHLFTKLFQHPVSSVVTLRMDFLFDRHPVSLTSAIALSKHSDIRDKMPGYEKRAG